jgi:predicted methyltransferase
VLKDCENFYSKLKPGGVFAGHDYRAIEGVRKAADEFAAKVNAKISETDIDVWYWVKQ